MFAVPSKHVCIESYALHLPPDEVTSAELEDRIAPLYERLKIPFGTLEKLSGVATRRLWRPDMPPSEVATVAAKLAMNDLGFDPSEIKVLINCSVARDYFEPGTACIVHGNLELPEDVLAFDVTNACIGFSNGIQILSNMIERGIVKAGMLVSGESIGRIVEATLKMVVKDETLGRDQIIKLLPTLTLGCGAAAMVLCHESIATKGHRIIGSVARSASQHKDLCVGNDDFCILQRDELEPIMFTESSGLISSAAKLGGRMWSDFSEAFGWSREDVNHIFCHQVGKQVNEAFYRDLTLDMRKEFTTYQRFGNMVTVSLPGAFMTGIEEKPIRSGEKVLLTAYGSGLNSIFLGIEW